MTTAAQLKPSKMLFLTPQLPYPPNSGGVIKSYHLVAHIAKHWSVTLACLIKGDDDTTMLKRHMPNLAIVSAPINIARTPINFLLSCIKGVPLTIFRNHHQRFKAQVAQLIDEHDIVVVDHYLMYQYIPKNYQGRVVLHQHNAEFMIWQRMAEQTVNVIKRKLLTFEAKRIAAYEATICQQADAILAAPNDQQALLGLSEASADLAAKFYPTYHLGDESNLYLPPLTYSNSEEKLLFVGTLSWQANLDGLLWFIKHVWPQIKLKRPKASFTIVGGHSEAIGRQILALDSQIKLAGFVKDLEPYFQTHRVFVAPLNFGSGIKVKVVSAMYRGMPLVTTSVGAEGLDVEHGQHLLIGDTPESFAQQVLTLLNTPVAWRRLAQQSRQLMASKYTWQVVYKHFDMAVTGSKAVTLENDSVTTMAVD